MFIILNLGRSTTGFTYKRHLYFYEWKIQIKIKDCFGSYTTQSQLNPEVWYIKYLNMITKKSFTIIMYMYSLVWPVGWFGRLGLVRELHLYEYCTKRCRLQLTQWRWFQLVLYRWSVKCKNRMFHSAQKDTLCQALYIIFMLPIESNLRFFFIKCDIIVAHEYVAKQHCVIEFGTSDRS
jgi:hypothetical protein